MISNPGFSFSNHIGSCTIKPHGNTEFRDPTSLYSELIICDGPVQLKSIYTHNTNNTLRSKSPVLKFSDINIDNNQAILDFCNEYGLIGSQRNVANFTTDYLFFDQNKNEFSSKIPLYKSERIFLTDIKKAIIAMNLLIELSDAIDKMLHGGYTKQNEHSDKIVEIITYFCFDLTIFDFPNSSPVTELFQFNHAFYRHAEKMGYHAFDYKVVNYSEIISSFLGYLVMDTESANFFRSQKQSFKQEYPLFDHTEWRHLRGLFYDLLSDNQILSVDPFGKVTFAKPLSNTNYLQSLNITNLSNLAKAVLSDLFKENLHMISPEIQFENGHYISTWRIPTLLNAMYLELFFLYSPNHKIKLCANPSCRRKFEWRSDKPTQKYCSINCATCVAQRMKRKRDKEKSSKEH